MLSMHDSKTLFFANLKLKSYKRVRNKTKNRIMLRMTTITRETAVTAFITLRRPLSATRELCQLYRVSCQLSRLSLIIRIIRE